MAQSELQQSFWWYFVRVVLLTVASMLVILLFSDKNYGINKTVGWYWEVSTISFWLGLLFYSTLVFAFFSIITVLIMKIVKLTK